MDYLKATKDDPDTLAFQYPFELEEKAIKDHDDPDILEDGDLIIEGLCADFEGLDRQNENFEPGAFQRGVKAFIDGQAPLCFHHKKEKVLGKVLDLKETDRGLWMKARVDGAIKDHPELGTYYKQIKKGSYNGLSVGGWFKKKWTGGAKKIVNMDFYEVSITGVPVHTKPSFAIVAGKALLDDEPAETEVDDNAEILEALTKTVEQFEELAGVKAVTPKGDPQDLYFLALLLDLEKMSNNLVSSDESEEGGAEDKRVDALVVKTREALDSLAKEAHSLASKLGPLPDVQYAQM